MTKTLAELLAPMPVEQFLAEYHDRQPLHLKGSAAKFAPVLSWRQVNRLLDMTHAWSSHSLQLVLDGKPIAAELYCTRAVGRDANAQLMQPVATRVREWVAKGASLVLNDVDSLTPGLAAVSNAIEAAGLGKAQANVYISWQSHKAFPAHYDTHDVWACRSRARNTGTSGKAAPSGRSATPPSAARSQAHHEQAKGRLRAKVLMQPGDLLYLPRGWYHDALAGGAGERPRRLWGPRAAGHGPDDHPRRARAVRSRLPSAIAAAGRLGRGEVRADPACRPARARIAELCRDPKVMEVLERFVADYRFARGGNDLLAWRARSAGGDDGEDSPTFRVESRRRQTRPARGGLGAEGRRHAEPRRGRGGRLGAGPRRSHRSGAAAAPPGRRRARPAPGGCAKAGLLVPA
jgi:hypothetical protein